MPSASFRRPAPIRGLQPWYFGGDYAAVELLGLLENADLLANLADVAAGDKAGFHVPKQSHDLLGRVFQCRRTTAGRAGPPTLPDPPAEHSTVFANFSGDHYQWARKAAYAGLLDTLQGMGGSYDFWASATRGEVCGALQLIAAIGSPVSKKAYGMMNPDT
ncbi:MAG: hypothetical protein GX604_06355 [Actinobacteria bacterium]|nr:hypothetical protein [Actinomycetota bacterium]